MFVDRKLFYLVVGVPVSRLNGEVDKVPGAAGSGTRRFKSSGIPWFKRLVTAERQERRLKVLTVGDGRGFRCPVTAEMAL